MRYLGYLLLIVLAGVAGFTGSKLGAKEASVVKETVYDRVMRTGIIRCGYFIWNPLHMRDATGRMVGISADVSEALAKAAELKIEWAGELAFSSYIQDIHDGRYDAECSDGWPNAVRGKYVYYSVPYAYLPLVVVVKADDTRFDAASTALDDPRVKIANIDGETSAMVTRSRFPKAQNISLPQTTTPVDMILNVVTGKADATLTDSLTAYGYIQANPGKVKMVQYRDPIHLIALNATLPQDEKLKNLFDNATNEILQNGTIEAILKKYESVPGLIIRAHAGYKQP